MKKIYNINKDIYPENILENAIEMFNDYWDISFENGVISIVDENELKIDEIFNELMNYVIWLINE